MKELYKVVRDLVNLTGTAALTRANPTGQFLKTLPRHLQQALVNFERTNRGHRHQLSDEALSPGDMLTHPLHGSPEHARRHHVCDTSRDLLAALVDCEDLLPAGRIWYQLLNARDDLGWLAYHAELLVAAHCGHRNCGLPAQFVLEDSRVSQVNGKVQLALFVRHRRTKVTASRTFQLHSGACDTLRSAELFVKRSRTLATEFLKSVPNWAEFQSAKPDVSAGEEALFARARAELVRALNPFSIEERQQLIQNWAKLCPNGTAT